MWWSFPKSLSVLPKTRSSLHPLCPHCTFGYLLLVSWKNITQPCSLIIPFSLSPDYSKRLSFIFPRWEWSSSHSTLTLCLAFPKPLLLCARTRTGLAPQRPSRDYDTNLLFWQDTQYLFCPLQVAGEKRAEKLLGTLLLRIPFSEVFFSNTFSRLMSYDFH